MKNLTCLSSPPILMKLRLQTQSSLQWTEAEEVCSAVSVFWLSPDPWNHLSSHTV